MTMLKELRQVPELAGVCERSLEVAVEEQSLLNVRDFLNLNGPRYINLLTLPKTPDTNSSRSSGLWWPPNSGPREGLSI